MKKLVFAVLFVFVALFCFMIIGTGITLANAEEAINPDEITEEITLDEVPEEATEATEVPEEIVEEVDLDALEAEELKAHLDDWKEESSDYFGDPYLVLVNKEHPLPLNWPELIELDEAKNSLGEKFLVEHEALLHYYALREYLRIDHNITIELDSTYRTPDDQKEIWEEWLVTEGADYCKQYLAPVGYSEHHTGLAIDIFIMRDGKEIRENDDMLADVQDFGIIHANLARFGFILRYLPGGKENVTGYKYECWHLRYVGSPEIAKEIMDNRLTLEEYIEDDWLNRE